MQTQCSRDLFGYEVVEGRQVVAAFDGGEHTTEAGALLLGATDRAIGLVGRFAACFIDHRTQAQVEHTVAAMVAQRVFYEDLIDHDQLRRDPVLAVLAGKLEAQRQNCAPLAGKSTLNRLEHAPLPPSRYHKIGHDPVAIEDLFVDLFLEAYKTPPGEIVLDLDATDDPLHGHQEDRFFHAYYDCYCYLPLYVFCGRHLLAAKLRRSNIDAPAGATDEVARIVGQIRARWPRVKILLRADSGFARDELMTWCEANGVDYVFGLARNERLVGAVADELAVAEAESLAQAGPVRHFADFPCLAAGTGAGPRFPTRRPSAGQLEPHATRGRQGRAPAQGNEPALHRDLAAGERNRRAHPVRGRVLRPRRGREPDQGLPGSQGRPWWSPRSGKQLDLFADRTSAATMRANQLRLWFASFAYLLLEALRRIGLRHTQFANATCGTIRLKLLKIGAAHWPPGWGTGPAPVPAPNRQSVRRIKIAMASGCPYQTEYHLAYLYLHRAAAF